MADRAGDKHGLNGIYANARESIAREIKAIL